MEKLFNEINSVFEDFQFTVSDLQAPNPIFIGYFLYKVLEEFEVDLNNVKKVQISQHECSPEEVEIIQELNLVVAVRAAFPFLKLGLFNILNPGQKRTADIIGKTLQFYRFCDEMICKLETQMSEYRAVKDNIEDMLRDKEVLTQQLNEFALQNDSVTQKSNEIGSKIKEISHQLIEIYEDVTKKEAERDSLKSVETQLITFIEGVEYEYEEVNSEIGSLKSQIVANPEIYKCDLEQKEQEKLKVEEEKICIWAKLKEKSQRKKHLEEVAGAVNSLLQHLDVFETCDQHREKQNNFAIIQDEFSKVTAHEENRAKQLKLLELEIENEEMCIKEITEESEKEENTLNTQIEENSRLYEEQLSKQENTKKEYSIAYEELDLIDRKIEDITTAFANSKRVFTEVQSLYNNAVGGCGPVIKHDPWK